MGQGKRHMQSRRLKDLQQLGGTFNLPSEAWETRMFFIMCPDGVFLRYTNNAFPKTSKGEDGRHPLFVLQARKNFKHSCCPCSSKHHNPADKRYIRQGCRLLPSLQTMDTNSNLIESSSFQVPIGSEFDTYFLTGMCSWGVVPEECIKEHDK